jgi:DNA-binding response OmpR family regulator
MISLDEKTITSDLDRAGYRKMGVSVKPAKSWSEAAKILALGDVDVVVVNLDVTHIDAIDIMKHIRVSEWKHIPIVATSVQASQKLRQNATKSGADLFVEQPVPRDYFIEKVKALLDQKTRTTERVDANIEVKFKVNGKEKSCGVGDLSVSGVLLATDMDIASGEFIELSFMLGASNKPVKIKGEVVRRILANKKTINQMSGLGVRFVEFHGDSQQRIESYIARSSDKTNKMAYYL